MQATCRASTYRPYRLSFKKKKKRKNYAGLYIGYRNGLWLNEDVANKNGWTVLDIESRTENLVKIFLEELKK